MPSLVVGARLGVLGHLLQLAEHLGVLVDAEHDDVAGVGPRHAVPHGVDLVEDDLDLAAAHALLADLGLGTLGDEVGRLAGLAAAQALVLADDDDVEVLGRDRAELAHVVVPAVTGRRRSCRSATTLPRSDWPAFCAAYALDELTEHRMPGRVVAVVDEDVDVVHVDQVHPAGGEVVAGGEGAQALPDLVQPGAGGEGRTGRSHGVGDVELRGAAEGRRAAGGSRRAASSDGRA